MQLDLLIKRLAMLFGVDLRAYHPARSEGARLARMLAYHKVDLVLDVGANTGQYARYLRSIGYRGRIICFEPLAAAHASLCRWASRDPDVTVAPRQALGEEAGSVAINVSANSESSSILAVGEAHLLSEPGARPVAVETVALNRLDEVATEYLLADSRVFLKIDVQGYELPVLCGAAGLLPRIQGLQLELSLYPLYDGEPLYREVIDAVERSGYTLHDVNPCFSDAVIGRTYQVDGIFFRE